MINRELKNKQYELILMFTGSGINPIGMMLIFPCGKPTLVECKQYSWRWTRGFSINEIKIGEDTISSPTKIGRGCVFHDQLNTPCAPNVNA